MPIDHDQIHKTLIEFFFREFMELFCPEEARLIDFAQVVFLRDEHFTDFLRGRKRHMDLVAKVKLKQGGERFVLVHFEFESRRPAKDFSRRMFQYFCQLFLRHGTDVIAVAVFTDGHVGHVAVPSEFEMAFTPQSRIRFDFHAIRLGNLDYRKFMESENPLAYALMAKMNYSRRERVRLKADFLRLILGSKVDRARQSLLIEYVETYVPLAEPELNEFHALIRTEEPYKEVEKMVTVYEQVGREEGRQEGRQEGRLTGKQELIVGLLKRRFGKVPSPIVKAIETTQSSPALDALLYESAEISNLSELSLGKPKSRTKKQ